MNFGTLAPPVPAPAGGTFISEAVVALSAAPFATIRYTLDGTTPTGSSPIYTTPLTLTATTTVKAQAVHPDYGASAVTVATYTIQVAAPIFGMPGGVYAPGQGIPIATPTAGAAITFTLSGVDPTAADPGIPSSGVVTAGRFWLKARAWKGGCVASPVTEAWYDVTGPVTPPLVAAGQQHSLAVRADGVGLSWGGNAHGQVGNGTTTSRAWPGLVAGAAGVLALAGGTAHTVALRLDGSVVAWGYNSYGQLGDGTTSLRVVPVPVSGLTTIVAVSAGTYHTLALQADGTVMAWGLNTSGQVGQASGDLYTAPHLVAGLSGVTAVAAGGMFSLALTGDGRVWAWGANDSGQLGDGTTLPRATPTAITGLPAVTRIAAGSAHAVALAADGTLWAWGHNDYGQLGDGTATRRVAPVLVPSLTPVTAIAAGAYHTLGLLADGTVRAWGSNTTGQLGDGTTTTRSAPQVVPGLAGVVAVAGGGSHALALTGDGTVWAWGVNDAGQLGDGTTTTRLTPTAISGAGMTWLLPPPTLNVAGGMFAAPFDVTVTSPYPTASLHYTTTGVEPTEADPVVVSGGAITIDRTLTLKVRAWTPSLSGSLTAAATYTFNYGTLAAPVASPAGGAYPAAQTVTLTAAPGATIRYTLDGTDPTADSPPYLAPLTLGAAATLKARAFQADWTMSAVLTEPYTWADTTPPTITAVVSPPPTVAGWHTAAVEVSFVCADETAVATCPAPIGVTQDGAGQVVTGEAVDTAGNRATASVTINLDRTPPRLRVHTPETGDVLPGGTTTATVRGAVLEFGAGLDGLTCNGVPAAVTSQSYMCSVPVGEGSTPVVLVATDVAGHTTTTTATVAVGEAPVPTALAITADDADAGRGRDAAVPPERRARPGRHRRRVDDQCAARRDGRSARWGRHG
jgi:alpha-tubulin suppressor-like RCC1 family protein